MAGPDEPISMTVRRDGVDLTFSMLPIKRNGLLSIGITPASSTQLGGAEDEDDAALIASFLKGTDLWDAGLRPGMQVLTADGQPVNSLGQFQDIMTASGGGVVATTWSQPGESDQTDATGVVQVNLTAAPNWSLMRSPGSGDVDPGLLGLTPLVLINNVIAGGANEGVLLPGDVVLRFADIEAPRRGQFLRAISERGSGPVEMTLLRDGKVTTVEANIRSTGVFKPRPMLGINPGEAWDVMRVAQPILVVECDSQGDGSLEPVATAIGDANIQGGSLLRAIDGEPVRDWQAFFNAIDDRVKAGVSSVALTFENPTPGREARTIEVALTDTACAGLAQMSYRSDIPTGAFEPIYTIRNSGGNPLVAIQMGVNETINLITLTYLTIDRVFRGSLGVDQLQGPVGIVHIGTRIANRGFTFLLFFLALISVNLAVVNFLPIPIVDGGLFLNLIYEKIKGRPPSPGFQNAAAILGLVLIGGVFIMVTYNDLVRLVG
jgi:regulator of sigma E protease